MLGPDQGASEPDHQTDRGGQAAHTAHEDTKTHGLQGWYYSDICAIHRFGNNASFI